jgi:hypothetical protein
VRPNSTIKPLGSDAAGAFFMRMHSMDSTTRNLNMAAETGAGIAFGLKSGLLSGAFLLIVSVVSVVVGLTIVPPVPGREHQDIARRLAAGLLCSFTLGPYLAFKFTELQPGFLQFWLRMLGEGNALLAYLMAAAPFLALTALPGFWIVAALMRWFQKREGKDIGELVRDAKATTSEVQP